LERDIYRHQFSDRRWIPGTGRFALIYDAGAGEIHHDVGRDRTMRRPGSRRSMCRDMLRLGFNAAAAGKDDRR